MYHLLDQDSDISESHRFEMIDIIGAIKYACRPSTNGLNDVYDHNRALRLRNSVYDVYTTIIYTLVRI